MAQQLGTFEKVLRFGEGRRLKRLAEQAAYVATLEPDFERLSDAELAANTADFPQRLGNRETVEDLLFEAYAAVREAAKRALGQRIFDVQVMGGIVLHEGDIAEMKTGEGKTFVAVQPLYLNALTGNNVHLVTVIDYLRDNMAVSFDGVVQRGHVYAIVDEVDSILIDEARTPLIISGEPETAAQIYYDFARVVRQLDGRPAKNVPRHLRTDETLADYEFDEKFKTVS